MSYTDNSTRQWRDETSPAQRDARGMVRRFVVNLTTGTLWRTVGHLLLAGARELHDAEVFSGVGFYARPKVGHNAEAVVVFPGGAANPIIIATRDEDARKAMAKLNADETAVFNSTTVIVIKKDGTVEIRAGSGTAQPLPTRAEFNALVSKFNSHTHVVATTGTSSAQSGTAAVVIAGQQGANSSGTSVLKAQ